ncbi:hypothetical protein LUZ60_003967 [Juncus effusus]|nr:hypothetical protein LUZ60_003967 [Juncus effusus]
MHPKRRPFLPPLLLVLAVASLAGIFLYSGHHNSSLPVQNSSFPNPGSIPGNFTFLIKVLAYGRLPSLKRCLDSLSRADYGSDRVHLHVYLDHFKIPEPKNLSYINQKLKSEHEIIDFLLSFNWPYGDLKVHYRSGNVGLQAQWIEAWLPVSDDEFAFVVEDDLELSQLYYKFLKSAIMKYYYDKSNYNPSVFGITLQRPRFVGGKHGNKIDLDSEEQIFLYQMVGTWGQLLFPKPWREFRKWYDDHKSKDIKPILQGMVTTGWYKKMGERIWTPWFIKFIHSKSYFNIYTNFGKERALSVSHRDAGVNYGKNAGPDSVLITKMPLDINLFEMKSLSGLKWYDFCFKEVLVGRFVERLNELENVIKTLEKMKNVILVSLYGIEERVIRNLICHFERVGLRNYIFLGADLRLLSDLARRGHAVIDGSKLLDGDMIFVKGILVKKILDLGYNVWLMDGNMVPLKGIFPNPSDNSFDIFARKDLELMFMKNSLVSKKIFSEKFISRIQGMSQSFENKNFASLVLENLEKNVKIGGLDMPVDLSMYDKNGIKFERELERKGLWLVDEDSSCNAVVCQPQFKPK